MTARTGTSKSKKRTRNITEAVRCHCARHYRLEILTNVSSACVQHYADFGVISVRMRCTRPSPGAQEGLGTRQSARKFSFALLGAPRVSSTCSSFSR